MKSNERRLNTNALLGGVFGTKTRSGVTAPRAVCRRIIRPGYRLLVNWMKGPGPSLVTLMNSQSAGRLASGDTRCWLGQIPKPNAVSARGADVAILPVMSCFDSAGAPVTPALKSAQAEVGGRIATDELPVWRRFGQARSEVEPPSPPKPSIPRSSNGSKTALGRSIAG